MSTLAVARPRLRALSLSPPVLWAAVGIALTLTLRLPFPEGDVVVNAEPRDTREEVTHGHADVARAIASGHAKKARDLMSEHIGHIAAHYSEQMGDKMHEFIDWR